MRVGRTGRAIALALVFFVLAVFAGGCAKQEPKPREAAQALKTAQQLESQRRDEDALKSYTQALHDDPHGPTAPRAALGIADLAIKLGKPDQASTAYTALRAYPKPAVVQTERGTVRIPQDLDRLIAEAGKEIHHIKTTQPITAGNWFSLIPYRFMDILVGLTGRNPAFSYWIAIFIFTIFLKLALNPLTVTQLRSSRKMMLIQPRLKKIQDEFRDRPEELNRRMMALYKDEGVNPIGCGGGMILQMAIMLALYHVIRDYQFQFYNAKFLWIGSGLARQFPQVVGNSLAMPDKPLLVLYAISMFVQQRLTMVPTLDPQQAQQQKMMGYMMPVMLFMFLQTFPSAFALYWLLFNILSTVQMIHINQKLDEEMGPRGGGGAAADPGPSPNGPSGNGPVIEGTKKSTAPPLKKGPGGGSKKNSRR
jgi:YidC/Oxa1 family membrane protein insertase